VAARLGYETSALDMDLLEASDAAGPVTAPVILIGEGARHGVAEAARGLSAGQGALYFLRPSTVLRSGGIQLAGNDATGLLAVSSYFSSRIPNVWSVRGATWDSVTDRITRFLEQRDLPASTLLLERMVVDANRRGVNRAELTLQFADSVVYARAVQALERDSAAAQRDTTGGQAAQRARLRRSDLQFTDLHRIDITLRGPGQSTVVRLLPARPWETRPAQAFTARDAADFTLSDLYTIRGLYRDTNQDLIPDRTESFLSVAGAEAPRSLVHLAARLGLETAGMRLPFVQPDAQNDQLHDAGFPILYGLSHYQTERLRRDGRLSGKPSGAGTGQLRFVPGTGGVKPVLVVTGSDARGLDAIGDYVARRLPYVWEYGKGNMRLQTLETDVRRFFQAREAPGQIALGLHKLDAWLARLKEKPLDSIAVELRVKEAPDGLDAHIQDVVRRHFPASALAVRTVKTGFGEGRTIFEQDITIPWEVDDFWKVFRSDVLPRLDASSRGRIEVRVSEAPEIRVHLMEQIKRELRGRGVAADAFEIVVINAYKQGFSWLQDVVLPRLRGKDIGRVDITYHTLKDSKEVRWQVVESDTRWLQEIFPIDAVYARDLDLPDSLIMFQPTQERDVIYTVRALDRTGGVILQDSFAPKYVVRPFFDLFPEYEQLRVTTGWVNVQANGATLVDQRIRTDPERFWDFLQTDTYAKIVEYFMDVQEGRPAPGNAPYFDEFRVELTLSEPNHRIGIDEEVVSSLEALHEDIYFETLTLFDLIGFRYGTGALNYAGRVLPYIQPAANGKPGRARIRFTGKERAAPELILTIRERGKEPVRDRYPLSPLNVDAPRLRGIAVRAGEAGLAELAFDVVAIDSVDRYAEYRQRGSEESIDRTFLSVPLFTGMVSALRNLHSRGILENALAWDRVGQLAFRFVLRDTLSTFHAETTLPRSRRPASTQLPVLRTTHQWNGERIVQWQTPIPPAESDSVLARLATFPGVTAYWAGRSFLGRNIFAADFLPPHDATHISQAKRNALKPTLLLSGRQHANEVSSTSHILRLGELLVTDSSYARLLRKANVVLHPITNADGAQLAWEMQLVNPDFMLHAGYLGALGVDATSGGGDDPIYPESRVRPELQETWLPDIYMNLHGYPSHEWVQLFAGYSGWVRGRTGTQRSWWAPRGWFVPGFSWVDDPRAPELKTAQFAILDSVAAAITGNPAVKAMNDRMYARYSKYGRQDVENFREHFHNGILVYSALRGREATGQGVNNPRITYFSMTTEAPDETARGAWLELVNSAGLAHTSALLRYLASGVNEVRRDATEFEGFVLRSAARRKPVLPAKAGETRNAGGGS
jgi:hypothetical protein